MYLNPCMKFRDLLKPTIAQIQGYCIMGGLMLASAMDLIIAAEDVKFSDQSVRMACPAVEYFPVVWDIGGRMTKEMLFTGDFMDAQTALRCGLVNRVVPNDKLEEETLELARRIAKQNPFLLKRDGAQTCLKCHPQPNHTVAHSTAMSPTDATSNGTTPRSYGDVRFSSSLDRYRESDGTYSCIVCHEAHGGSRAYFLRRPLDRGALCFECHSRRGGP